MLNDTRKEFGREARKQIWNFYGSFLFQLCLGFSLSTISFLKTLSTIITMSHDRIMMGQICFREEFVVSYSMTHSLIKEQHSNQTIENQPIEDKTEERELEPLIIQLLKL